MALSSHPKQNLDATKNTKFSPKGSPAVKKTPKGVVSTPKQGVVSTPKDVMYTPKTPDVSGSPALKKSAKITPRIGSFKKSPVKTTPVAKGVKRKSSLSPPSSKTKKNKVKFFKDLVNCQESRFFKKGFVVAGGSFLFLLTNS